MFDVHLSWLKPLGLEIKGPVSLDQRAHSAVLILRGNIAVLQLENQVPCKSSLLYLP
jgi:hypothetical protein